MLRNVFGWQVRSEDLAQAGQAVASYWHYLGTGHFGEADFENWESEFPQMGSYVPLTADRLPGPARIARVEAGRPARPGRGRAEP